MNDTRFDEERKQESDSEYTRIPTALFGLLTTNEIALCVALSAPHGTVASHAWLAEMSGMGGSTVKRTLNSLREKGLVTWEQRRHHDGGAATNEYRLAWTR